MEKQKREQDISNARQADKKSCNDIVAEWHIRLLEGEIFIADKNTYTSSVCNQKERVENSIALFSRSEGFRESHITVKAKKHRPGTDEEFTVYYPSGAGDEIHFINVEIVTDAASFIHKVVSCREDAGNRVVYRGHNDWAYHLRPGIYREGREKFIEREGAFIREIITTYPKYFTECKTALDYLSVMQHYGFPTRLLDFSENPLIALFMACDGKEEKPGDVIRVSVPSSSFKFYDSDTVAMLSNVAMLDCFEMDAEEDFQSFNRSGKAGRLMNQIQNEKTYFEARMKPEDLQKIVFVKTRQNFDRISHQSGLFALFGIGRNKQDAPVFEMMKPLCQITHYIIPAECKQDILRQLSCLHITRASVYCDLENVARYYLDEGCKRNG